ncbi:MAG: KamA family radical SAM protein [Patescibacteria group bacterium]
MKTNSFEGSLLTTAEQEEPPSSAGKIFGADNMISCKGQHPFCSAVPEWKKILKKSAENFLTILRNFNIPQEEVAAICARYPARVNSYYLSLIKEKDDPIYKQCIPNSAEILDLHGEEDPLYEEPAKQTRKGVPLLVTHRYPDRILLRISNQCAMYCRFCTRKRTVGDPIKQPTWLQISRSIEYIKKHEEIRDVILSGGDPLMLDDEILEKIIAAVYAVISQRKNGIIRIGTRMPCTLPQRITSELCAMLKKYHPLFINTHFNHPNEITSESRRACGLLVDAGIPVGCQTVLLKGVNDKPEVMKELMLGLLSMRVKPYYIYQADPVKGANHFRAKVQKGLDIYRALRGHISGLAVPAFVIDAPGGGGKIPILPEYLVHIDDKTVVIKNYEGKIFTYNQP